MTIVADTVTTTTTTDEATVLARAIIIIVRQISWPVGVEGHHILERVV